MNEIDRAYAQNKRAVTGKKAACMRTDVIRGQYDKAAASPVVQSLPKAIRLRAMAAIAGGEPGAVVAKMCAESDPQNAEKIFRFFEPLYLKAG